jgi:hypothetical protein
VFYVDGLFRERFLWLARHSDAVVFADEEHGYATFDFKSELGVHIGIASAIDKAREWPASSPSPSHAFARVGHIGIVVRDIERAARTYTALFGVQPSRIRRLTPRFPKGMKAEKGAAVRFVQFRQPNIAVHLFEPSGDSPMREFVEKHGNAVYEIGFDVGRQFRGARSRLIGLGGEQILGGVGDRYAQIDLGPELGVVIGLTGSLR